MEKIRSIYASAIAVVIMAAGVLVGLQIMGWFGEMILWPVVWGISRLGCIGDILPKSLAQQMLVRFLIGVTIVGALVVKMSLSQRKNRGRR